MNNSRRRFLIRSFAAAGVAATGRLFWISSEEFVPDLFTVDKNWLVLDPDDRLVLAMITPVILQGVTSKQITGTQLVSYLKDYDKALSFLTDSQKQEFKQLLSLLKSLVGRVLLAGIWSSWNNVSSATIDAMLSSWRNSYLDLLKTAYKGLKELSFAVWYGSDDHWQGIGYPGPPVLLR